MSEIDKMNYRDKLYWRMSFFEKTIHFLVSPVGVCIEVLFILGILVGYLIR